MEDFDYQKFCFVGETQRETTQHEVQQSEGVAGGVSGVYVYEDLHDFDLLDGKDQKRVLSATEGAAPRSGEGLDLQEIDEGACDERLPHYACQYCGIHEPACVARCNIPQCRKWFCNAKQGTSASHIVAHIIRSKHKEVSLHQKSPLGETTLECYNCQTKNVCLLGFVPARSGDVVILLCREPCLSVSDLRNDPDWDLDTWQPLIEDKSFVPWLVEVPDGKTIARARQIKSEQVARLEEAWKSNPEATLQDLDRTSTEEALRPVTMQYASGVDYHYTFAPLLQTEAEYDRQMKEAQAHIAGALRWDIGLNKKRLAHFLFPKNEADCRLVIGDALRLRHPHFRGLEWKREGTVVRISAKEEIVLEFSGGINQAGPWEDNTTEGITVEFCWNSISYDRMRTALSKFSMEDRSIGGYLYYKLLGSDAIEEQTIRGELPREFAAPGLAKLNHSQIHAVRTALQSPLCLIQGPPGTGKTVTSATIVYHLVRAKQGQVLVCAPSNVAVDHLAERLHMTNLKVVRLYARSRETISSTIEHIALHKQIRTVSGASDKELFKLLELRDEIGELNERDDAKLKRLRAAYESELIGAADVICTTCIGASDPRLRKCRFQQVLIDEATQATEPETLVPIVMGAKQVILVGDHCQLGPVVMCKKVEKAGLAQSMFERLVYLGNRPVRLEIQYRMHPCLSHFPSLSFYEGSLQNGVTRHDRLYKGLDFPWPKAGTPMFFYHSNGTEEISGSGTSFLNTTEAYNVEKLVTHFLKCGLKGSQIGVITPYEGQRAHLASRLQRPSTSISQEIYRDIEVASVDAFQGREKDFIILSCVRSNSNSGIGFLNNPRRLNVALTRSRYGLVVCGNAKTLGATSKTGQTTLWGNLLYHFKSEGLVVEGPLSNLKPSSLTFPKPMKHKAEYLTRGPRFADDGTCFVEDVLETNGGDACSSIYSSGTSRGGSKNVHLAYQQQLQDIDYIRAPAKYFDAGGARAGGCGSRSKKREESQQSQNLGNTQQFTQPFSQDDDSFFATQPNDATRHQTQEANPADPGVDRSNKSVAAGNNNNDRPNSTGNAADMV